MLSVSLAFNTLQGSPTSGKNGPFLDVNFCHLVREPKETIFNLQVTMEFSQVWVLGFFIDPNIPGIIIPARNLWDSSEF